MVIVLIDDKGGINKKKTKTLNQLYKDKEKLWVINIHQALTFAQNL